VDAETPQRGTAELAGELRTVVSRLAYQLRLPATRSGITPTRLSAMVALAKGGPLRPGDLAAKLGISPASMSRLAEILETGGWISRSQDPQDQRACLLSLTPFGADALDELRREGTSGLAADLAGLSPALLQALQAALPALTELADRHLEPS
jgi:DNA-binding MarR family transcriptional regulator